MVKHRTQKLGSRKIKLAAVSWFGKTRTATVQHKNFEADLVGSITRNDKFELHVIAARRSIWQTVSKAFASNSLYQNVFKYYYVNQL